MTKIRLTEWLDSTIIFHPVKKKTPKLKKNLTDCSARSATTLFVRTKTPLMVTKPTACEFPPAERKASGNPPNGGLNQQLKCQFGINSIDSGPQPSPLYRGVGGGDLLQLVVNPPKSPFTKGDLTERKIFRCPDQLP